GRRGGRRRDGDGAARAVELRPVRCDHREGRPAHPARGRFRPRVHADVEPAGRLARIDVYESEADRARAGRVTAARGGLRQGQVLAGPPHLADRFDAGSLGPCTRAPERVVGDAGVAPPHVGTDDYLVADVGTPQPSELVRTPKSRAAEMTVNLHTHSVATRDPHSSSIY